MDLIDDIRYAYVADQIGEHQSGITSTAPLGRTIRDVEREATERFDAWLAEEHRKAAQEAWMDGFCDKRKWAQNPYWKDNA